METLVRNEAMVVVCVGAIKILKQVLQRKVNKKNWISCRKDRVLFTSMMELFFAE